MVKKVIQYLLIATAVGSIIYVLYKFYEDDKEFVDSFAGIPNNVNMVMDVHNFSRIGKYEEWLKELVSEGELIKDISFNPIGEWPKIVAKLDSLRTSNEQWQILLLNSHVVFANTGPLNSNSWIISIGLQDGKSNILDFVKTFGATSSPADRNFKDVKIYLTNQYQFAAVGNCLVISPSPSLIEEAIIKNQKKQTLTNDSKFEEVKKMSGMDIPLNFYFLMSGGEWMQLDPLFDNGTRLLSGYAVMSDTSANSLKLTSEFSNFTIANYLPASTDLLEAYSYEDFASCWQQQQKLYEGSTSEKFWGQAWKDYGDSCMCDLNEMMLDWRSGEWGNTIIPTSDSTTGALRYFKVRDSLDVTGIMQSILIADAAYPEVFAIRYPQLFDRNQPQSFLIESNYLTQIDGIVFIGKQPKDLISLRNNSTSLAKDSNYINALKQLGKIGGRLIFQKEYYVSPLPQSLVAMLSSNEYIGASVTVFKDNKYLINVALPSTGLGATETTKSGADSTSIWSYFHPTAISKAWPVINHNTSLNEVIFQDQKNSLHLISSDGILLWKKDLANPVLQEIKQLDALKNGKLQYAFTTMDGLHIIDRNGNYLNSFPIKTANNIESGLQIFDYDKQKNYRLIFTTDDGMIQNYTVKGFPTEGWKYKPSGTPLFIDHFKSNAEDQLLVIYENGSSKLLKRNGEEGIAIKLQADGFSGKVLNVHAGATLEDCSITYADGDNKIWIGLLVSGNKRKIYESSNKSYLNIAGDLNLDGKDDFVICTGNQIKTIDDSGEKIFEHTAESELRNPKSMSTSLSNPLISVSTYSNSVLLYRGEGAMAAGFPKIGREIIAVTDINGDKKQDYIILTDAGINAEN